MQTALQELYELLELLQLEKAIDLEHFKQSIQHLSLHERVQKGYTWYPLQVLKSGYTYGERAFVILQRNNSFDANHHFRSGKTVSFFTQQAHVHRAEFSGVINFVNKNKMKIVLNVKDIPQWINGGNIGVDMVFDDRSYLEMEKAMKLVIEAKNNRLADLRSILLGKLEARFFYSPDFEYIPSLNESQNKAIHQILAAQDIAIIHGPPGTGKTTTLVQAIKILCRQENTIIVTAPSNTAVDLLTERLSDEGLNVVRVGNISRVEETIIQHTLDARLAQHPEAKNIKKVKIQAAECRRKAQRFKRTFNHEDRQERNALYREAGELSAWANQLEDRLLDQILSSADVICCTLVGASNKVLERMSFRTAIVDEAAQALEPATWIPITKASKVILTGDPYQLPPTIKSRKAEKKGLNNTLIEKSLIRQKKVSLLNIQYRMHQDIMGFSNMVFYDQQLKAADTVAHQLLPFEQSKALVFIDTAGCGFEEKEHSEFKSKYNLDEFNILREHLLGLTATYDNHQIALPSIAIISPYKEQTIKIKDQIEEDEVLQLMPIRVDTIDAFQGQESEVIYISMVRSNSKAEIGFLADYRRMNVAMTRAKKKLVIIGDSATIGNDSYYAQFLDYCDKHGSYQTAWEYML